MKLAAVLAAVFAMVSCEKSGLGNDTAKDQALQKANEQFVDGTVVPTYKALADECLALQSTLEKLKETKTDALVKEACKQWKDARQFWEWRLSFLVPLHNMELTLISIRGLSTRPNLTKCCPTRELWTILINMFPISTMGL